MCELLPFAMVFHNKTIDLFMHRYIAIFSFIRAQSNGNCKERILFYSSWLYGNFRALWNNYHSLFLYRTQMSNFFSFRWQNRVEGKKSLLRTIHNLTHIFPSSTVQFKHEWRQLSCVCAVISLFQEEEEKNWPMMMGHWKTQYSNVWVD